MNRTRPAFEDQDGLSPSPEPDSFPRSAWECRPGRSAAVLGSAVRTTRSVEDGIPTRSVGTSLLALAAIGFFANIVRADEPPKAAPTGPVLNLVDGGFAPGEPRDSDRPGTLRWQSPAFATPFDFSLDGVASIRFPVAEKGPRPAGAFGFELTGGDVLYGSLVALDDKAAELDVPKLGRLKVERSRLRRFFRWKDGADLVYNGPNGLSGWREFTPIGPKPQAARNAVNRVGVVAQFNANGQPASKPAPPANPPSPKWRDEGGQLVTDQEGATIQADVGLPARARLEVELSWKNSPDFLLALGVGDTLDDQTAGRAFRVEVWDGQLVLARETDREADLATLGPIPNGPGEVKLQVFLDQESGKIQVFAMTGEPMAELKLGGGPALPGLRLTSHRGDLRLERLQVARWDGETPRPSGADPSRIQLVDGSIERGQVERLDPQTREFVVRGESGESRVPEDKVAVVQLAKPGEEAPGTVLAVYQDGTRIGGDWVKFEGGSPVLKAPGIEGPLRLPLDGMRSIDVLRHDGKALDKGAGAGTLEMDGLRLVGHLADSDERPGESSLAWQPLASESAARLRPGTSGKIVYRAPPPKVAAVRQPAPSRVVVRRNVVEGVVDAIQRSFDSGARTPNRPGRRSLYLRSGDIIPAEVERIDEAGVTFKTEFSASTFVPNARVKAVELAPEVGTIIRVDKTKRERLLTLPRMQKDSPPTHLIRSKNGDFLRGRIVSMDDRTVRLEIRLEEKDIPRDRVSRIIWLHADETDPSKKPAEAPEAAATTRVQAVRTDGIRLTFAAERFAEGALSGKSDVLGPVRVRPQDLDQLLFGGSVEKEATQLAYQNWKLQNAPEPKSAQEDAGSAGTESALVGKAAPDFTLDLLGGRKFHLADNKGKVIVLDFWATWCGPCLQAMPQIDKVTHEFADKGVQLVAVNLQESPDKITALLERVKLSPTVALDRDGVVAERYAAHAIPQTVVIDREGKVTRLFVGGGPHLGDQLREALRALMPAEKP